jgi:hypothetical protein
VGKVFYSIGVAVVIALFTLAQRLANYTNTTWAYRLVALGCLLSAVLVGSAIRDVLSRKRIVGEAFHFEVDDQVVETGIPQGFSVDIRFKVTVRSQRPHRTNVAEIRIDGSKNVPPIEFSRLEGTPSNMLLELGISSTFDLYARATFRGVRMGELTKVNMTKVKIWLVDGTGTAHRIPVRTAQTLSLS